MKRSLAHGAGFLEIDHTNSPGITAADVAHLPEHMRLAVPGGDKFEADALTCSHCQAVVLLNPARQRPRGYCAKCDHYLCDRCTGSDCVPAKAIFDRVQEHAAKFERQPDHPDADPMILLTDL